MMEADPVLWIAVARDVDASQVALGTVEQAPAQRNLLALVFCAAVPIVGVVACVIVDPPSVCQPQHQRPSPRVLLPCPQRLVA